MSKAGEEGLQPSCGEFNSHHLHIKFGITSIIYYIVYMIDYHSVFLALNGNFLIIAANPPHYTIIEASYLYNLTTSTGREIIGKSLFEIFPPKNDKDFKDDLEASFHIVINQRKSHRIDNHRYDILENGKKIEKWWTIYNIPLFNDDGDVGHIINSVVNITEIVKKDLPMSK